MKYSVKKLTQVAFLTYALASVIAYVVFHFAYLYASETVGAVLEYISFYLSRSLEFIAFALICTLTYAVYLYTNKKKAFLFALVISSAYAVYSLPYNYIISIYNYGYDSVEAIVYSLIETSLALIITLLGVTLCIVIATIVLKRGSTSKKEKGNHTTNYLTDPASFDFLDKANLPILVFVLVRFCVSFLTELIDTVIYLIEYSSDYTASEVTVIVINYLHIFILLVVSYIVCVLIKNVMVVARSDSE